MVLFYCSVAHGISGIIIISFLIEENEQTEGPFQDTQPLPRISRDCLVKQMQLPLSAGSHTTLSEKIQPASCPTLPSTTARGRRRAAPSRTSIIPSALALPTKFRDGP